MTLHHRYGPSSMKNREICPGWENDPSSDKTKADEGTLMHLAFEKRNLSLLHTPEQREQVQKCINFITPYEGSADEVHREVRLEILGGETFGTADEVLLWVKKQHALIFDAKFGQGAVDDAEDNRQGFSYVIGTFERWEWVNSVEVIFGSPRRDEITRHTFTRADLPRLALTIKAIIARAKLYAETKNPNMLNMTEENCAYCKKLHCPKVLGYGLDHARRYAPLEVADEVHSSQITDPAKMAQLYTAARVMERLVDSVKKHVQDFARQNELPGYELRERAGATKITNAQTAYPVLRQFLDEAEIASISDYSYTDALKLVSAKAPRGQKTEAAKKLFNALLDADAVKISDGIQYLQRKKETVIDVT